MLPEKLYLSPNSIDMKRIFFFSLIAIAGFSASAQTTMVANQDIVQAIMVIDSLHFQNLSLVKQEIGYPKIARENNIQGTLEYFVTFDETGKAIDYNQLSQGQQILSDAVEQKIMHLKIDPWKLDMKPSKVISKVSFEFKL